MTFPIDPLQFVYSVSMSITVIKCQTGTLLNEFFLKPIY